MPQHYNKYGHRYLSDVLTESFLLYCRSSSFQNYLIELILLFYIVKDLYFNIKTLHLVVSVRNIIPCLPCILDFLSRVHEWLIFQIVGQCNEAARKKEREVELVKTSNTLHFPMEVNYVDIIADNRWLLRSGTLTCLQPRNDEGKVTFSKKFNKLPLTLYLFNDMFLVTKKERLV